MSEKIPAIDVAPLFGPASPARDTVDQAVLHAASGIGFMTISGFPGSELLTGENRARMLQVFRLPDADKAKLLRWNFDNARQNVYRGWFPLQPTAISYKEGIDMGPDIAHEDASFDPGDPLCERTPLPDEKLLPAWRDAVAGYYVAMERLGNVLMRSVARGLDLPDDSFDAYFDGGISTLRLIRYPLREANAAVDLSGPDYSVVHKGENRTIIGKQHADSGFVTLLAQDGVEGLQARNHGGEWIDVPPADGTLAVNFGQLLERWTGGKVRATLHRVIAPKRERFSIPFFLRAARRRANHAAADRRRGALRALPLRRLSLGCSDEFRRDGRHQGFAEATAGEGLLIRRPPPGRSCRRLRRPRGGVMPSLRN